MLDSRMHKVEYYDGSKKDLSANMIAENIFANVDEEFHRHLLLDSIIYVRKSSSTVGKEDAFIKLSNGANRLV